MARNLHPAQRVVLADVVVLAYPDIAGRQCLDEDASIGYLPH
ncbi:protein of unknown function [Burkholderia multivorans]